MKPIEFWISKETAESMAQTPEPDEPTGRKLYDRFYIKVREVTQKDEEKTNVLKEALLYLYLENPENKKCEACEPGNQYNPEYICGVHKLMIKIEDALS